MDVSTPQLLRLCAELEKAESVRVEWVNLILLNTTEHSKMNGEHLNHWFETDVLTFPFGNSTSPLSGEIYVNMNVARQNASEYGVSQEHEVCRLFVHGLLHLCGYDDATTEERNVMRSKEDQLLIRYM